MKKLILFIFILSLLIITLETAMTIRHGLTPYEPDPRQFKYQYVDIYKKFFKEVHRRNKDVYISEAV